MTALLQKARERPGEPTLPSRSTTPPDVLTLIGEALYGRKRWIRPLSLLIGVNCNSMVKWRANRVWSFDRSHRTFPVLIWHLRRKAFDLTRLADAVERWTQNQ